jgi:hypothetical protein
MKRKTSSKGAPPTSRPSSKTLEIVVFSIVRDSQCSECGTELLKGQFLRMEAQRPLCMTCADLDHLVFLPRGDTALTRRASRYSRLRAVVVRFSRSRKRYERQGILIEDDALTRAEEDCRADEDARLLARERAAQRRATLDEEYVERFAERVGEIFPGSPAGERRAIAEHACQKYSGRVGRSAAAKRFEEDSIVLAVRARVRHAFTSYDELLMSGLDRSEARAAVSRQINELVDGWSRVVLSHVSDG